MRCYLIPLMIGAFFLPCLGNNLDYVRPQRYAAYRAHKIMPASLRFLVKRDAREMFSGLEKALALKPSSVTQERIMLETDKITQMIDQQASFKSVIHQMGFVSGLVAVYTNPSLDSKMEIRRGFQYYLNSKLDRCLFVFDGHKNVLEEKDLLSQERWLRDQLTQALETRKVYKNLLEDRYDKVGGNWRYNFSEKSAVFGVSSIYFSNMARLTAHLWYYAWASAHGDLSRTPYRENHTKPGGRGK